MHRKGIETLKLSQGKIFRIYYTIKLIDCNVSLTICHWIQMKNGRATLFINVVKDLVRIRIIFARFIYIAPTEKILGIQVKFK